MSFDPKVLAGLFSMSRDAVLGISQGEVIFLNPAAEALFQAKTGDPADNIIPAYILSDPADRFVASVRVNGRDGYASVSRAIDILLVSFVLPPEENAVPSILSNSMCEFSNSLMATRLAADVILKYVENVPDDKLRTHSAILYQNYYRMKRLCEHIGKADALQRGTLPFSPREVALDWMCMDLCNSLNHLLSPAGITVVFESDDGRYDTLADQALLETLLLNAVANSVAHMSPGEADCCIRIRLSLRNKNIILAVIDNGTGISPDALSPVMDGTVPSALSDTSSGTGLGLRISRGIAELHGGALILESRENQGTKLRVSLPIRLPEAPARRKPSTPYNKDGMNTILTELSVILDRKFYNKTMFD